MSERSILVSIERDDAANKAGKEVISKAGSSQQVFVIPADEELMLARHCLEFM